MIAFILMIIMGLNNDSGTLQSHLGPVLDEYFKVKDALVQGDNQAAYISSNKIVDFLETDHLFSDELIRAAGKLAASKNLEIQRAEFAGLGTILWKLVKEYEPYIGSLYYQYCPMKKAYWLSKDAGIQNPFYGKSMLGCGITEDRNGE